MVKESNVIHNEINKQISFHPVSTSLSKNEIDYPYTFAGKKKGKKTPTFPLSLARRSTYYFTL